MRGFQKIMLQPGASQTVEFELGPEDFGYRDADGNLLVEPGEIVIMSGTDSENLQETRITLV